MKLLHVDFSNLVIRHAANPYGSATDSLGRSLQGPYGAVAQVLRYLHDVAPPTHLLIARDSGRAESVRREIDPAYKAHRPDADDDLRRQFQVAYAVVDALRWPGRDAPGYEADDVIASAARAFSGQNLILTGDKDLLALCARNVRVALLRPGGPVFCNAADCYDIYGVHPHQVRDYKALVGDSSDGIPGVPGIGPKTACKLIGAYGTVAAVYERLDAGEQLDGITKSMTAKLIDGRESARRSWRLAGLVSTLPVDIDSLAAPALPDAAQMRAKLEELDALCVLEAIERNGRQRA